MSIASAPERLPTLELHYRPLPGVAEAALMTELLDGAQELLIEGPFGNVRVTAPLETDLLLIAGGSGIAQCRAIVDHLRHSKGIRTTTLVWSVTQPDHLYCNAELRRDARWLRYEPVIDTPQAKNAAIAWLVAHAPQGYGRIIVSGGPGFVYAVVDKLEELGVTRAKIESDVFSYAPR